MNVSAVGPELMLTFIEQTLQPGPPVSLSCSSSANPAPRIVWKLEGAEIRGGGEDGYSLGSYTVAGYPSGVMVVSHLNISSARVIHGGLYTCEASNGVGKPVSHSAALNIYGKL
ncbi:hypothetical protein J437_LFUL000073 [Ladona fulva]|uniref:Ig-like domain-containing protein n=1 Tax=Ladona fulva TaxID=123851 RepID=A0A8K0NZ23_LADFU|nr:hypothetical protein J437_LFUL000073 [Ladona fulva]